MFDELFLLLLGPFAAFDGIIQMVVVTFSTLLAIPAFDVVLELHNPGDLWPLFNILLFVELFENAVFLHVMKGYVLGPSFSFRHSYPLN